MAAPAWLVFVSLSLPALAATTLLSVAANEAERTPALVAVREAGALPFVVTGRFRMAGAVSGRPAVAPDGSFFIGAHDGVLYAFDRHAHLRWQRDLGAPIRGGVLQTPAGELYVGTDAQLLWSFDSQGTLLAKRDLGVSIETTPVWSSAGHVVVSAGRELVALQPDGATVFRFRTWNKFFASPVVDAAGGVFIGAQDGNFYSVASDGSERFRVHVDAAIDSDALLGDEGVSFFADVSGRVHGIDEWGEESWVASLGAPVRGPLTLGPGGEVLAVTQGPRVQLFALDPATGKRRAQIVIGLTDNDEATAHAGVAVDPWGRLWFGAVNDRLWMLKGLAAAPLGLALSGSLAARPWFSEKGDAVLTETTGEVVTGTLGVNRSLPP